MTKKTRRKKPDNVAEGLMERNRKRINPLTPNDLYMSLPHR